MVGEDNAAVIAMSKGQQSSKTKYFDRDWYLAVDRIKRGEFELVKVDTAINRADLFTKALRTPRFLELKDRLIGGPHLQNHVFEDTQRIVINLLLGCSIIEHTSQVSNAPTAENHDSRQKQVAFENSQSAKPTAPELASPAPNENVVPSSVSPLANALEDTLNSAQGASSPQSSKQQQLFFSGFGAENDKQGAASGSPSASEALLPLVPVPSPAGFGLPAKNQDASLSSPFNKEIGEADEADQQIPTASKRRLSPSVDPPLHPKLQKMGGGLPETDDSLAPENAIKPPRTLSAVTKQTLSTLQSQMQATPPPAPIGKTAKSPKAASTSKAQQPSAEKHKAPSSQAALQAKPVPEEPKAGTKTRGGTRKN